MLHGLKKLFFGQPEHYDEPVALDTLDGATEQELILANIELGRQIDAIRGKRKAIHARLAQMKETA